MNPLIEKFVGSVLRHVLTGAFVVLAEKGWIDPADQELFIVGLIGFVLTVGWSFYQKYGERLKFKTALEMPSYATEQSVKDTIAARPAAENRALALEPETPKAQE